MSSCVLCSWPSALSQRLQSATAATEGLCRCVEADRGDADRGEGALDAPVAKLGGVASTELGCRDLRFADIRRRRWRAEK